MYHSVLEESFDSIGHLVEGFITRSNTSAFLFLFLTTANLNEKYIMLTIQYRPTEYFDNLTPYR